MLIEHVITATAVLLLLSIFLSKASEKFGVPALLLFLVVGMLAGSEGLGGIHFDNPRTAQAMGTVALAFILFAGGLSTDIEFVRPILWRGVSLATLGVLITAGLVGAFTVWTTRFSWLEGMLLGAIVASTDAAAVFSVLRSRNINLKGKLQPLLELESGSNDPMAVFLTVGIIGLMKNPTATVGGLLPSFFLQMALGAAGGYALGKAAIFVINRLKLEYEGLYPAVTVAVVLLVYGLTVSVKSNGFLAVYVAGLVMGNSQFIHRSSLLRFHDALAWLMQIAMFLALGLLVFPSQLAPVAGKGLSIALFLMLAARPASVFLSLVPAKMGWREKALISWVGLRGAAPIILATFPLVAGLPKADDLFNIVFFIVLTSALIQGLSITSAAKLLKVDAPFEPALPKPLEIGAPLEKNMKLVDFIVPYASAVAGRPLVELDFPEQSRITILCREDKFIVPGGNTALEPGDVLWVLGDDGSLRKVQELLKRKSGEKRVEKD